MADRHRCLSVFPRTIQPAQFIIVQECNSSEFQQWIWPNTSGGHVQSAVNDTYCLDVYGDIGPWLDLWPCHAATNQQWILNGTSIASSLGGCLTIAHDLEVWATPLEDENVAVILFNRSPAPANIIAHWKDIGIDAGVPCKIRDLWLHQDLGIYKDFFSSTVAAHGVVMIRVSPIA